MIGLGRGGSGGAAPRGEPAARLVLGAALGFGSRARRVSSSFLRASAASRSARSRFSRSARARASASWRLRSSSSRTRASFSARARASRSSSVSVRRTTPVCGRGAVGLTGGRRARRGAARSVRRAWAGRRAARRRRASARARPGRLAPSALHGRGASPSRPRRPWCGRARSSGARRPARRGASATASCVGCTVRVLSPELFESFISLMRPRCCPDRSRHRL